LADNFVKSLLAEHITVTILGFTDAVRGNDNNLTGGNLVLRLLELGVFNNSQR